MTATPKEHRRENTRLSLESDPPGRYLLREDRGCAPPFEAEIVEWSESGRVKLRYATGSTDWREPGGFTARMPLFVERISDLAMAVQS